MSRDHLVRKQTIDKNGKLTTVLVRPQGATGAGAIPVLTLAGTPTAPRVQVNDRLDAEISQFLDSTASNRGGKYRIAELADPDFATDRCASSSFEFLQMLRRNRPKGQDGYIPGVRALDVEWEDVGIGHRVSVVDGHVVDFTARQFDPGAPFPLIEPIEDYLERCSLANDLHEPEVDLLPAQTAVAKLEAMHGYLDASART